MKNDYCLCRVLVILIGLGLPYLAHAQVYTWVDENGKTHYSDKKPLGNTQTEVRAVEQSELETHNIVTSDDDGVDVDRMSADRLNREQERQSKTATRDRAAAMAWRGKYCYVEVENVLRGNANGGSRVVGTTETKRCNKSIPRAYQPYLSGYSYQPEKSKAY